MFMYSPLSMMYTSSVVIFSRRPAMTFGFINYCSVSSVKKPQVAWHRLSPPKLCWKPMT